MSWGIVAGVALGALVVAVLRLRAVDRRARELAGRAARAERERETLARFARDMVEALADGAGRNELMERIAGAALRCAGAGSACFYEATPDGGLRGAAVEGLFPPQRTLVAPASGAGASRARLVAQVLRSETLRPGEGVVGEAAARRKGVLVGDARADARVVRHGDPSLEVRSLIAVPVACGDRLAGVIAVVNPVDGGRFSPSTFSLMQQVADHAALALRTRELTVRAPGTPPETSPASLPPRGDPPAGEG